MQSANQLGIYLRKDRATVVCPGRPRTRADAGSAVSPSAGAVGPAGPIRPDRSRLPGAEDPLRRSSRSHGLCRGHAAHGAQRIQRPQEDRGHRPLRHRGEVLATDVSDVAVSFRVASSDDEGAGLESTAQRALLTEIIQSLQVHGIDPVAIDPDICCLSRYLVSHADGHKGAESSTLYGVLSDSRGDPAGLRTGGAVGGSDVPGRGLAGQDVRCSCERPRLPPPWRRPVRRAGSVRSIPAASWPSRRLARGYTFPSASATSPLWRASSRGPSPSARMRWISPWPTVRPGTGGKDQHRESRNDHMPFWARRCGERPLDFPASR